ncbi:SDR family NAD(P)-dependent oxidoreductase [Coralloluteibacterium stylophorae]|uniref:SDR family NAD(P)-dependent oxidoreductase n=1 Tax=Coralloluteibacterium stylophorae TaxID=1776034 RepID=A0A8J7VRG7_9GAMM|nr:SDR family NAD(P)-dependent oxidoreductase [Coralloluteibacterium stylophorae]MBS7456013.1 SDR family NAD(P)-dependent oxidoreductase [Coralloluteibacterium stylophorae]
MSDIRTGFGRHSTAADVLEGVDLAGKRVLVTGGAAGIGLETSRALARAGAEVLVAVRDPARVAAAVASLREETGNPAIDVARLDLADLRSVAAFAAGYRGPLHVLVNNAGIMALPELTRSAQGHELQFAVNYLGHFALTLGLRASLAAAGGARVICVASSGHLFSPVVFDDIGFDFIPYTPFGAYGQSKTAAILAAVGISRRWADDGILANALHPGAIATGLQKHTGGLKTPEERRKSPAQGAATTVLLAASPLLDGVGGRYFEDCNEAAVVPRRTTEFSGCAPYALDADNAERLWRMGERLVAQA